MTEMAAIPLPCGVSALETAMRHASHQGHWHEDEVRMGDGKTIVICRPKAEGCGMGLKVK